ncbi:helix-turn-helix transcriptional regulator [Ekhidna sp.]|uniref:helix-turn-helix domain-containing protein n=1 Tax=Ekhidna sp. TaxID=2608089 RepID=UPI0032999BA5
MHVEVSLIQLITVCAVINGIVFAFLLFEKKENRQANQFLSLMILSMCLTLTPLAMDMAIWNTYQWLAWLPFSLSYWIGPSFYFYIKILTGGPKFRKKDLWHFSPIVLNYLHSAYHAALSNADPWPYFHHVAEVLESAAILSIVIYLILSYRLIEPYRRSLFDNVSNTERIDLRWVSQIIYIIAGVCLLFIFFLAASTLAGGRYTLEAWDDPRSFLLLAYAGILYWMSISGFKQAQIHKIPAHEAEENESKRPSEIVEKLDEIIRAQKLYGNPELSLTDLSRAVDISERSISDTINQELNKNFYQLINEYRVEEIKMLLQDPGNDHLKILSMAFDAGFNSKASFNRVFKQFTGMTPKEFKSQSS